MGVGEVDGPSHTGNVQHNVYAREAVSHNEYSLVPQEGRLPVLVTMHDVTRKGVESRDGREVRLAVMPVESTWSVKFGVWVGEGVEKVTYPLHTTT